MKPRVWVQRPSSEQELDQLRGRIDVVYGGDPNDLPGAEAVIVGANLDFGAELMDRAGAQLKAILRTGIGVDNVDIPAASERGILVVHTPDGPTESTSEHTVALLLSLAKRTVMGDMSLRNQDIDRPQLFGTEVRGRVLGLVGLGRIGRRVAEICAAGLKMRVIAYDPYVGPDHSNLPGVEKVDSLEFLLQTSDFVSLHTPLTEETRNLIGESQLLGMKAGSYLINASRGPVVDEAALARVLQSGHLAGAALDVFEVEPPPPEHPLLAFQNVVATPHIGSYTDLGAQAMWDGVTRQLFQLLDGERPRSLANPEVWPGRVGLPAGEDS